MASVVLIKVISIVVDVINENKDEWFMVIASFTNSGGEELDGRVV